jgi:hypothetical protein
MNALETFLLKIVLGLVRSILLSSLEKWVKICLYAKFMLMILYLVLLTNHFVMILKKFVMDKAKAIKTSMDTNSHLDLDLGGTSVDQNVYHSMIGSFLYLCASRPNIMLSVCMCARFQAAPKDCHLRAVKRIMRYLVLTPNLGLWYPKGCHFELLGYLDADYAECKVDRKCTSRTCQFLGWSLVSWSSKK